MKSKSGLEEILAKYKVKIGADLFKVMNKNSSLYEELYEYYMLSGEMPYGVAKARTGDPVTWIVDTIETELEWNEDSV